MKTHALFLGLLLALPAVASAQECSALKQNTLTSFGCPASCKTYPCVLYAPSLAESGKICTKMSTAAGLCASQTNFTVPDSTSTSTCNVTYQCMEMIVVQKSKQWLLAVAPIGNADTASMAYVTQIKDIKYDASAMTSLYVP